MLVVFFASKCRVLKTDVDIPRISLNPIMMIELVRACQHTISESRTWRSGATWAKNDLLFFLMGTSKTVASRLLSFSGRTKPWLNFVSHYKTWGSGVDTQKSQKICNQYKEKQTFLHLKKYPVPLNICRRVSGSTHLSWTENEFSGSPLWLPIL